MFQFLICKKIQTDSWGYPYFLCTSTILFFYRFSCCLLFLSEDGTGQENAKSQNSRKSVTIITSSGRQWHGKKGIIMLVKFPISDFLFFYYGKWAPGLNRYPGSVRWTFHNSTGLRGFNNYRTRDMYRFSSQSSISQYCGEERSIVAIIIFPKAMSWSQGWIFSKGRVFVFLIRL